MDQTRRSDRTRLGDGAGVGVQVRPERRERRRRSTAALAASVAAVVAGLNVHADTATWQGGNGNWSQTALWGGVTPGSLTNVFIDGGKTGTPSIVTRDINASVNSITIDVGDTLADSGAHPM